jgi:hypothetical protein
VLSAAGVLVGTALTMIPPPPAGAAGTPTVSIAPKPVYTEVCAATLDTTPTCLSITLAAIDHARAGEGLGALHLPSAFSQLSVPAQVFVALNRERTDRGLAPFASMSASLGSLAAAVAAPGAKRNAAPAAAVAFNDPSNGLDALYQWLYNEGPGSGLAHCTSADRRGCWVDRRALLATYGSTGSFGAALDLHGDTEAGTAGAPELAVVLSPRPDTAAPILTWADAQELPGALPALQKLAVSMSTSGIPSPTHNVDPIPDYTKVCADTGIDSSAACIGATLAAVNHARALEGVRAMVLPTNFGQLPIPEQLFVAINLERVDRGLPPFEGMTDALDQNAAKGAASANDPPDAGDAYFQTDGEWSGGNANGLDAVYGWMYNDGYNSGNLDCPHPNSSGCWGHRTGLLDDFGQAGTIEMGTAFDPTGDNNKGDLHGPSMAATLALTFDTPGPYVYTWAQAVALIAAQP